MGTLANGDAANGNSPARCASSSSRSIAARVRATTGCAHNLPLSIRVAGLEHNSAASRARSSFDVSVGRSVWERSSCRNRCQGSPLLIPQEEGGQENVGCVSRRREKEIKKKGGRQHSDHRKGFRVMQNTYSPGTTIFDAVSSTVIPKLSNSR